MLKKLLNLILGRVDFDSIINTYEKQKQQLDAFHKQSEEDIKKINNKVEKLNTERMEAAAKQIRALNMREQIEKLCPSE